MRTISTSALLTEAEKVFGVAYCRVPDASLLELDAMFEQFGRAMFKLGVIKALQLSSEELRKTVVELSQEDLEDSDEKFRSKETG